ncbi:MAG: glycosyltransferase family 4 protein [Patescibacteria group bacterium]|nr:glycosyltransferase family 4 protein [Patescibacteria group bacterium]
MKIVFLQDDFPPTSFGGAGISTYELAKGVQKAGHEVFVITTVRNESEAGKSEYDGLTVYKIASDYDGRWRAWVSLYNRPVVRQVEALLRHIRPDVVHVNNVHNYLSYHCIKIAKRYAKEVVWTARDAMAFSYGKLCTKRYLGHLDARLTWRDNIRQAKLRYNPLRNFCIKKYLAYADKRFAVSDALSQALEQNGIHHVTTLHTGIDVDEWQASDDVVATFRKKYDLGSKKVILFGGRLGAGVQVVRAMQLLARVEPTVLLVMGREENTERMKTESIGLDVVYTGWLAGEEKIAAYNASDIVWVPSPYFDAFPRSALEASASGKPVIVTNYGGAPELVRDGETGYVVNPLHPQEIADKTLDLLQHPGKAAAFGRAGLGRVKKDFNLDDYVARYLTQYQALLG